LEKIIGAAAAVYFFETGEKDPDVKNNEAPSHLKVDRTLYAAKKILG